MRNRILVFVLFLLPFVYGYTQPSFLKGYVLLTEKDTLKGEIKVNPKKEFDNFARCSWRKKEGNEVRMYPPKKIIGYFVDSSLFMARQMEGEMVFVKRLSKGDSTFNIWEAQVQYLSLNEVKSDSDYYIENDTKDFKKIKSRKAIKLIEDAKLNHKKIEVKDLILKE